MVSEISDLEETYESLSNRHEIFVMPVRMREEKLRIPTDDVNHAIMIVDYFLEEKPLMLFAPRQIMEAWFCGAGIKPRKNLPIEVHVPGDLITKYGGIPIFRMRFITESEFAESISEIQNGQVTTYLTK
jgi:hypothetical protein